MPKIVLASGSSIRAQLLRDAGINFETHIPDVDESLLKQNLIKEDTTPENLSHSLAELKASSVSKHNSSNLIIGSDQVLFLEGHFFSKPRNPEDLLDQLRNLRGKTHHLITSAVVYQFGELVWSKTEKANLTMREFSDSYLESYIQRNWADVKHSVGGYQLEKEGVRLFSEIRGDYFCILGFPLLALVNFLLSRGAIEG